MRVGKLLLCCTNSRSLVCPQSVYLSVKHKNHNDMESRNSLSVSTSVLGGFDPIRNKHHQTKVQNRWQILSELLWEKLLAWALMANRGTSQHWSHTVLTTNDPSTQATFPMDVWAMELPRMGINFRWRFLPKVLEHGLGQWIWFKIGFYTSASLISKSTMSAMYCTALWDVAPMATASLAPNNSYSNNWAEFLRPFRK